MNAPERASAFLLDEDSGEQKVTYSTDTKVRSYFN
jgi:ribonuclease BN (tRNA processing enzyme)